MLTNNRICGLLGLAARAGKITFGTDACVSDINFANEIEKIINGGEAIG